MAERAPVRFETPLGRQSQIDRDSTRVRFRHAPVVLHGFVLTLGNSPLSCFDAWSEHKSHSQALWGTSQPEQATRIPRTLWQS